MFVFVVLTEIVDKEKSQELANIPGIQLPDNFATLDFNTVIRKSRAFVNSPAEKNSKSDLAEMLRGTERNRRGRKRLRREKRKGASFRYGKDGTRLWLPPWRRPSAERRRAA